jgi:hypothetical protein
MAQFGRPSTDTTVENWLEDGTGDNSILWDEIDETVADDADYIRSVQTPSVDDAYVTKLTTLEDPLSSTGHVVRYRYAKSQAGGETINLTVELRQGYVNEASMGTLIAVFTHSDISEVFTTAAQTLSAVEADSITNYADLFLRFLAKKV